MKSSKATIAAALDRPNSSVRFYLFHGADEAGSRALATRLLGSLDAEKLALTGAALKSDPAALADEAAAISMFGDRKLIWIEPAGEEILPAVEALLAAPAAEHPAVAIAGNLRKTSALLKAAEAHPAALAHVSYVPEGRDAARMVMEVARANGLRVSPALASRIAASTGNDQAVATQEVAKYALYLNASPEAPQELREEVIDLLGADDSETDASRPGDLALAGKERELSTELERLETSGIEPIPVVRALQRRLLASAPLAARLASGQRLSDVMASVWNRDQAPMQAILRRWSPERLAQVMDRVSRLERQMLLTPVDARLALGEELIQIARAAR